MTLLKFNLFINRCVYFFLSSFLPFFFFFYSFILSCIHSFMHSFIHLFIHLSNISPHQKKKKCLNKRLHFKKVLWMIFLYHLWWKWLPKADCGLQLVFSYNDCCRKKWMNKWKNNIRWDKNRSYIIHLFNLDWIFHLYTNFFLPFFF